MKWQLNKSQCLTLSGGSLKQTRCFDKSLIQICMSHTTFLEQRFTEHLHNYCRVFHYPNLICFDKRIYRKFKLDIVLMLQI